jgi:6,7-dimethyl-8-ribityllumazine synthase
MVAALVVLLGALGAVFVTDTSKADAAPAWRLTATVPSCPASVTYGQTVECTVTVTDLTLKTWISSPRTPTGTVALGTILDRLDVDGSPCTLVAVNDRSASCSITVTPTSLGHIAPIATFTPSSGSEFIPSLLATVMYADEAPLTITADDADRTYGDSDPVLGVTYDGFVLGEGTEVLDGELECYSEAVPTSPVGDHAIDCGGLTADNYDITWVPGTLEVTPAPLTVTADDAERTYGDSDPVFGVTYDGFVLDEGTEVLDGELECYSEAVPTSPVGDHAIDCGGLTADNYDITWVPGTLEVTPAPLTVTADDARRVVGTQDPVFGVTYDGFVLDEGTEALDGELECYSDAEPASPVGNYAIDCGGVTADNYELTWVPGTLEVLAAPEAVVTEGSVLAPGGEVNVASDGWAPESEVTVAACGTDLGVVHADASGRVRSTLSLPADLPTGDCDLVLTGTDLAGETYAVVLGITISADAQPTPTPTPTPDPATPVNASGLLPYTGGTVTTLVLTGTVALAAGAALVLLRHRNQTQG